MSENNLIKYTKAAASLCNDYRDTLFYSGLVAGEIGYIVAGGTHPGQFLSAAAVRELIRGYLWGEEKPFRTAQGTISHTKLTHCNASSYAAFFAISLLDTFICNVQHPDSIQDRTFMNAWTVAEMAILSANVIVAGGVSNIAKTYVETMWDYPRKHKPPGGSNPIVDKFKALSAWVGNLLHPSKPAYGPAMSRNLQITAGVK